MVSEPRAASQTTNRGDGTASGASARGLSRLLQCHASMRQACVQGGAGLSPWPAVSIGSVVLRLNDSGRRYMSRNGPRRVGDLRTPATSLQCAVEVGRQAMLVQNGCERRGSHTTARCGFQGPEIYRVFHDRSVKSIGGLASSGALVFHGRAIPRAGKPAAMAS